MTYSWHKDFFENKVMPQISRDFGYDAGFFAWLETTNKQEYDEITRLEQRVNDIWQANGDRGEFKQACQEWYDAVMKARGEWLTALQEGREPSPVPVEQQGKLI